MFTKMISSQFEFKSWALNQPSVNLRALALINGLRSLIELLAKPNEAPDAPEFDLFTLRNLITVAASIRYEGYDLWAVAQRLYNVATSGRYDGISAPPPAATLACGLLTFDKALAIDLSVDLIDTLRHALTPYNNRSISPGEASEYGLRSALSASETTAILLEELGAAKAISSGFDVPDPTDFFKLEELRLLERWRNASGMAFWLGWYSSLRAGGEPDWELWKRIALIDEELWQSGPGAVAREIDKLTKAGQLRDAIEKLEQQLVSISLQPAYHPNLHNGAPPLDDAAAGLAQFQFIKEKLTVLKAELAKFDDPAIEPDAEVIRSTGQEILEFVKKYGKWLGLYCVYKADAVVDTIIEATTNTLVNGKLTDLASNPDIVERLTDVGNAAIDLARALGLH